MVRQDPVAQLVAHLTQEPDMSSSITGPEIIKLFELSMKILNAPKYKTHRKFSTFNAQLSL